jgi:hypothetical protein
VKRCVHKMRPTFFKERISPQFLRQPPFLTTPPRKHLGGGALVLTLKWLGAKTN